MEEEKIVKKKSNAGAKLGSKHSSHRSYGKWYPHQKSDSGKLLKKKGPQKGTTTLKKTDVEIELGTIVNYLTFGKIKITHKDNIKAKLKPNQPMNLIQACREYGLNITTFYLHLKRFPTLNDKYKELKVNRRRYLKESAEINIESALTGGMKDLSSKEVVDFSFKMLEKTDKAYNPKMEIETKSISINLNKSSDDLYNDLQEILGF